MKHLDPQLLAAFADGQPLAPAQRAHLAACPQCSAEAAELRALMADFAEVPAPPQGLHQRTLQRLGLAPRAQRGWGLRWGWLGAAAMGAMALYLSLPTSTQKCPPVLAKACPPAKAAKAALGRSPGDAPVKAGTADPAVDLALAPQAADAPLATAPAQEAAGLGQAPASPAQDQVQVQEGQASPKATPTAVVPGLRVLSVRGNLLKPAAGDRLQVELALSQSGLLSAQVADSRGRTVASLHRGQAGPGAFPLAWDGQDAPSGAYTLKLAFEGQKETVKILLVR